MDWTWDTTHCSAAKFAKYLDYHNASIELLCRHYGKIGGLWFDGNWSRPESDWKESRLYATIRKYQPEAIIINNTGLGARGQVGHPELDSTTFEQGLPTAPDQEGRRKYLAGEMCETMNRHWGFGEHDFRFKSPVEIIERLCACRKVGANYLLNVGPTGSGKIPDYEAATLRIAGQWIRATGSVIYDVHPVKARCTGRDFLLKGKGAYYYFAFDLARQGSAHVVVGVGGNGLRAIEGLSTRIQEIRWKDSGETIPFTQSKDKSLLALNCTGYEYGNDLIVRVAELIPEKGSR